ncbi:KRAB-A domain-containing protein 2 [Araneus ventricosus]|uniref:KRAB-A domain-containing protein 2 n=1 Tax=Araneus ventricosus TaxID=182803 RepID=A0A4Y2IE70_ARAVE|nr:KRAB-A domain-containing protein 2 [Araneus ventricosus]
MCNTKKSQQHCKIAIRPITTKDFNLRSKIDFIDFPSTFCGDYKLLMNYQDHATKFCLLRPFKTKRASEFALELLKVFLDLCAPYILQSGNGHEFTSNEINELSAMWPDCKIVHERPRHPRSQKEDRGTLDSINLIEKIPKAENYVYQIGTKSGILKSCSGESRILVRRAEVRKILYRRDIMAYVSQIKSTLIT